MIIYILLLANILVLLLLKIKKQKKFNPLYIAQYTKTLILKNKNLYFRQPYLIRTSPEGKLFTALVFVRNIKFILAAYISLPLKNILKKYFFIKNSFFSIFKRKGKRSVNNFYIRTAFLQEMGIKNLFFISVI